MEDARIGRFLSIDPLAAKYPHYSPFSFSGNKVIAYRELEGLEEYIVINRYNEAGFIYKTQIQVLKYKLSSSGQTKPLNWNLENQRTGADYSHDRVLRINQRQDGQFDLSTSDALNERELGVIESGERSENHFRPSKKLGYPAGSAPESRLLESIGQTPSSGDTYAVIKTMSFTPLVPQPRSPIPMAPIHGAQPIDRGATYGWYADDGRFIEHEYRGMSHEFFGALDDLASSVNSIIENGTDPSRIRITVQVQQGVGSSATPSQRDLLKDQIPNVYKNIGDYLISAGVPENVVNRMQAGDAPTVVNDDDLDSPFSYTITTN